MPVLDLHTAPHLDELTATVCVVGSGPAGGVVACQLAMAGIDVLLLEAGELRFDSSRRDSIDRVDAGAIHDYKLRYYEQLGGSSVRWGGRVAPFDAVDFEQRDWVPLSGWPIGIEELGPYYQRSSELMGVPDQSWFGLQESRDSIALPKGIELRCYQWASRKPFDMGRPLLELARRRDSTLRILLNAPVQRLATNTDRTRVEHVEIAGRDGRRIKAVARIFVLSAGAIQSPRLLLNSRSESSVGLGNEYGNVGRFLTTHPRATVATVVLNRSVRTNHPLFRTEYLPEGQRRYCASLSRSEQASYGLLNHHFQLLPYLEDRVVRLFEEVKRTKVTQTRIFDHRSRGRSVLPALARSTYRLMERATTIQARARTFALRGFLDQYPDPDNRVFLSDATDAHGLRMAAINWRLSQRDCESVFAVLERLNAQLVEHRLGHIEHDHLRGADGWAVRGIHSHFMGTTRMGDSPKTAVTDQHGRLFFTPNLYVAGPSLFPTSGPVNPFFTIVALSFRLADYIKVQLASGSEIRTSPKA